MIRVDCEIFLIMSHKLIILQLKKAIADEQLEYF